MYNKQPFNFVKSILVNSKKSWNWCCIDDETDGIVGNRWQQMRNWRSIWASKCGFQNLVPHLERQRKSLETTLFQGFSCGRGRRTWNLGTRFWRV